MNVTVVFVIVVVLALSVYLRNCILGDVKEKSNRKGSTPSADERPQEETKIEKHPETKKGPIGTETGKTERIPTPDNHNEQKISVYNSNAIQMPVAEGLPTLNYSKEFVVEYDASQKESNSLHYPFVKVPKRDTPIKYPVKGKNCRRGIVESSFVKDFLNNYFKSFVFDNLSVFIGSTPYEPDIAFIDVDHKNLFIDIEIDEPYDGIGRRPIHYVENGNTIDKSRNKKFTDRGWLVIRFSERQIKESPIGCCRFIYDICNCITDISIPALQLIPAVSKEKMWTKKEAEQMAKDRIREKYLGISQFQQSEMPRTYSIKDYDEGQSIERKILKTRKEDIGAPVARYDIGLLALNDDDNEIFDLFIKSGVQLPHRTPPEERYFDSKEFSKFPCVVLFRTSTNNNDWHILKETDLMQLVKNTSDINLPIEFTMFLDGNGSLRVDVSCIKTKEKSTISALNREIVKYE